MFVQLDYGRKLVLCVCVCVCVCVRVCVTTYMMERIVFCFLVTCIKIHPFLPTTP
jgi:hypothetical protein